MVRNADELPLGWVFVNNASNQAHGDTGRWNTHKYTIKSVRDKMREGEMSMLLLFNFDELCKNGFPLGLVGAFINLCSGDACMDSGTNSGGGVNLARNFSRRSNVQIASKKEAVQKRITFALSNGRIAFVGYDIHVLTRDRMVMSEKHIASDGIVVLGKGGLQPGKTTIN